MQKAFVFGVVSGGRSRPGHEQETSLAGPAALAAVRELRARWTWRDPNGQLHEMASCALLLKLATRGQLTLPAKYRRSRVSMQPGQAHS